MTVMCFATLLFVSTVCSNVIYSIVTGEGTIDRIKRKSKGDWNSTSEAKQLKDIFGSGSVLCWWLPVDPIFSHDFERVHGFAIGQDSVWKQATQLPSTKQRRHYLDSAVEALDV